MGLRSAVHVRTLTSNLCWLLRALQSHRDNLNVPPLFTDLTGLYLSATPLAIGEMHKSEGTHRQQDTACSLQLVSSDTARHKRNLMQQLQNLKMGGGSCHLGEMLGTMLMNTTDQTVTCLGP